VLTLFSFFTNRRVILRWSIFCTYAGGRKGISQLEGHPKRDGFGPCETGPSKIFPVHFNITTPSPFRGDISGEQPLPYIRCKIPTFSREGLTVGI